MIRVDAYLQLRTRTYPFPYIFLGNFLLASKSWLAFPLSLFPFL